MIDVIPQSVLHALFNLVPELKFVPRSIINLAFLYCFIEDPISSDFGEINVLNSCIKKRQYISFSTQYNETLSTSFKNILKKIQHRSYYRALDLLLFIPDSTQRHFILQVFNYSASYLQNNYDVNIVKLWINSIYIKKSQKSNDLIRLKKKVSNFSSSYLINIEFGFYVE